MLYSEDDLHAAFVSFIASNVDYKVVLEDLWRHILTHMSNKKRKDNRREPPVTVSNTTH